MSNETKTTVTDRIFNALLATYMVLIMLPELITFAKEMKKHNWEE